MTRKEASERNWKIFRLRGLWSMSYLLTDWRQAEMQKLVDEELKSLGARTHAEQRQYYLEKLDAQA